MFQGTCRRRKEPALGPDTQPLRTCHPVVRRSTKIPITATAREPGPSLRLSTKRPGKKLRQIHSARYRRHDRSTTYER